MPILSREDVDLHYERDGEGPPVLLIQGAGVGGGAWAPQAAALRGRYATAVFDNRGFGRSAACRGPVTIEAMADDAAAVLDALGWADAHVVGHSMGGLIAQQLALAHRSRVRSLSLQCTFHRGPAAARVTPKIAWLGLRTRVGTRAMRRRAFLDMVYPRAYRAQVDPDAAAAHLGALAGRDLADAPPILMQQLRAMARHDRYADLGALAGIPTWVASAAEDPIALPAFGELLAAAIPGARYTLWTGASHAAPIHDADRVNAEQLAFLDGVEAARVRA